MDECNHENIGTSKIGGIVVNHISPIYTLTYVNNRID